MVRVTNYFETQVRVPVSNKTNGSGEIPEGKGKARASRKDRSPGTQKMSDSQLLSWYSKILDGVRLRYRKLLRFARCAKCCQSGIHPGHSPFYCQGAFAAFHKLRRVSYRRSSGPADSPPCDVRSFLGLHAKSGRGRDLHHCLGVVARTARYHSSDPQRSFPRRGGYQ